MFDVRGLALFKVRIKNVFGCGRRLSTFLAWHAVDSTQDL